MIISKILSWRNRVGDIVIKAGNCADILAHLMYRFDRYSLETMNNAFFRPTLEYGYVIMSKVTDKKIPAHWTCQKEQTVLSVEQ